MKKEQQPVKTIVVKSDGIYCSHLEKPKQLSDEFKRKENSLNEFESYSFRIAESTLRKEEQIFTSSLIKVENKEVILNRWEEISGSPNDVLTFGTYPAPDGLVMEVTCKWKGNRDACGNETCWDLYEAEGCQKSPAVCLVSFLPDKEQEKPDAYVEPKDFASNLGGFQITIIPNAAISEGKPIMMMNPIDYDKYKESFLPNPPKA